MYCITCGNLMDEKLNYCNRCGNRVVKNELAARNEATVSVIKTLSVATGVAGVVGLGGLIGLIAILIASHVVPELAAILAVLFAATAFSICFMLTRQISRLSSIAFLPAENAQLRSATEQLNAPAIGQIEAPVAPFRSVTENTTRTLGKTEV